MLDQNISISKINIPEEVALLLFGVQDNNFKYLKKRLNVNLSYMGGILTIKGPPEDVKRSVDIFNYLLIIMKNRNIDIEDINTALVLSANKEISFWEEFSSVQIKVPGKLKNISAKSSAQKQYIEAVLEKELVFAYGPAGTGKTFLAVAMAVNHYVNKKINRIILTRPAVEAGERLGFLPGDLSDKINPYLRPLYDALYLMIDPELVSKLLENSVIEVAPLAFMRGRTLSNAFVILDEAQNTTASQMKMFLTRLGFGSKAVVTGDYTQTDLPVGQNSGLVDAIKRLNKINEIGFIELTDKDVVRHALVSKIIKAYDLNN